MQNSDGAVQEENSVCVCVCLCLFVCVLVGVGVWEISPGTEVK